MPARKARPPSANAPPTAAPELLEAGAVVVVVPEAVVTEECVEVVEGEVAVAVLMADVVETVVVLNIELMSKNT